MKDKRGVFKRVFVPVAVVSAIAIGSATYLSGINSFTEHKENVTNSLLNAARYLSQGAQSNPADAAKILREAVEKASKNPSFRITLLDGKGKILMDSDSTAKISEDESDQEEIKNAIKGEENVCLRTSGTMGKEVMYAAVPVFEKGGKKVERIVRTSLPQFEAEFEGWVRITRDAGIGASVFILILATAFFVAKKLEKDSEKISAYAKSLKEGDLSKTSPNISTRQLEDTANFLSDMAKNMQKRIVTLNKRTSELSEIFANMRECLFICNADGRFLKMNAASGKFFNVDEGGVRDRMVNKIIFNEALLNFIDKTFSEGSATTESVEFPEKGGKVMNVTGAILPYDAKAKRAIFVMNDITEIRALEKMRRNFVAGVSHELKTPITSVRGFIEALRDTTDEKEKSRVLDIIERESIRMNSLVDDMLLLSKLEHFPSEGIAEFEEISLEPLLKEAASNYSHVAEERNVTIKVSCPESVSMEANSKLLSLAVSNLVSNAIKHSREGGSIEIKAEKTDKLLEISVRDDGDGIDPEHLDHIFERFYRIDKGRSRNIGGTGLGLSLVKHIAILHGASVSAESKRGEGSVFKISKKV